MAATKMKISRKHDSKKNWLVGQLCHLILAIIISCVFLLWAMPTWAQTSDDPTEAPPSEVPAATDEVDAPTEVAAPTEVTPDAATAEIPAEIPVEIPAEKPVDIPADKPEEALAEEPQPEKPTDTVADAASEDGVDSAIKEDWKKRWIISGSAGGGLLLLSIIEAQQVKKSNDAQKAELNKIRNNPDITQAEYDSSVSKIKSEEDKAKQAKFLSDVSFLSALGALGYAGWVYFNPPRPDDFTAGKLHFRPEFIRQPNAVYVALNWEW